MNSEVSQAGRGQDGTADLPRPPAALVFDVDGTLAETEEAHRAAFNAAFAEAGLGWSWDVPTYTRLLDVTGGKERIASHASALGQTILSETVVALHRRKTALYGPLAETLTLRPGVARLIGEARAAGVKLAIATTTSRENVSALLNATLGPGAEGWFAAIGAGDAVAAKKPAPDIFLHVLAVLGADPERCVAFEDSANGLAAARAAALPTVVTVSAYTEAHDFDGALIVLDHLGDPGRPATRRGGAPFPGGIVTLATLSGWLRR